MIDVSIIIVNYNTLEVTRNCLESIRKNTEDIFYEIILVDNASTDGSVEYFKNDKDIDFISSFKNLGFGRANNLGAKKAKGEFLFFLNSDTILLNNAIKIFKEEFENLDIKNKVGVIGTQMLSVDLKNNSSYGRFDNTYQEIVSIIKHMLRMTDIEKRFNSQSGTFQVDWIVGADMFLKKELFEKVGGFDEKFFMYSEEVDLQRRIVNVGYGNFIVEGPKIIHLEGASSQKKLTNNKRLMVDKSRFIYYKKHSSRINYLIYRFLYFTIRFASIFNRNYTFEENKAYLKSLIKSHK